MSIIQGKCLLAFTLSAKRPFNLNNYTMLLKRRHHILSLHTLVNGLQYCLMLHRRLIKYHCKQHLSSFTMTIDVSYDDSSYYEFYCL